MKKRIISVLLVMSLAVGLVGCSGTKTQTNNDNKIKKSVEEKDEKYVAFVTDVGSIDDKSYNEGSWKGVKEFADSNGYKSDFFRTIADSEEGRIEAVEKAVSAGADVIVCVGSLFEKIIYKKQQQYKDKEFLFVDGEPRKDDGTVEFSSNVHSILFKEEECGYLAGYTAVKEGYKKLGFLGGMEIPAVIRFGYGFVQGAEASAKELGVKDVTIEYQYAGVFEPSDAITNSVKKWYADGLEVVFSCGGGILYSVIEAAGDDVNNKIIGVDVDQSGESNNIVFSAMKGLAASIIAALEEYEKNNMAWPEELAGKASKVGIKEDGVGLSATEGSWRVKNMTIDEYNTMIDGIKKKDLVINGEKLPTLQFVKVDKQETIIKK